MKALFLSVILMLASHANSDKLTGRWQSKPSDDGNVAGVVFREDQSFEAYMNGVSFVSGSYSLTDSLFRINDSGCPAEGRYKISFFAKGDSVRFDVVDDACSRRAARISQTVLGRVKD